MAWNPEVTAEILELYGELWNGVVRPRKAELFVDKLQDHRPEKVKQVLFHFATWREVTTRPTIGQIVNAVCEQEQKSYDPEPGEDQGEPISFREYLMRVQTGIHVPQVPDWEGGGDMPLDQWGRGIPYLQKALKEC